MATVQWQRLLGLRFWVAVRINIIFKFAINFSAPRFEQMQKNLKQVIDANRTNLHALLPAPNYSSSSWWKVSESISLAKKKKDYDITKKRKWQTDEKLLEWPRMAHNAINKTLLVHTIWTQFYLSCNYSGNFLISWFLIRTMMIHWNM